MDQGYQTQNLALAVTLATCGVPFYEADGNCVPVMNIYSAEIIREMRCPRTGSTLYRGWKLEAAANDAWKTGREGKVVFCFKRTPELDQIVNAYNAQHADIEKGEVPADPLDIEPAQAARLACQLLSNRKFLRDAWKKPTPLLLVTSDVKTESKGEGSVTTGSARLMSLNASKETRAKLKL